MIPILVGVAVLALFTTFCARHFFVQLISMKLLMDTLIFLLSSVRNGDLPSLNTQAASLLIAALSALVFFVLMAAGIHRLARSRGNDLEVRGD